MSTLVDFVVEPVGDVEAGRVVAVFADGERLDLGERFPELAGHEAYMVFTRDDHPHPSAPGGRAFRIVSHPLRFRMEVFPGCPRQRLLTALQGAIDQGHDAGKGKPGWRPA